MGIVFHCPVLKLFAFEHDVRKVTLDEDEVGKSYDNSEERTKQIEENSTHSSTVSIDGSLKIKQS